MKSLAGNIPAGKLFTASGNPVTRSSISWMQVCLCLLFLAAAQPVLAQNIDDARRLINNQDYRKARKMLTDLIATGPKNLADLQYELGRSYLESALQQEDATVRSSELEQAKAAFNAGVEKSRKSVFNITGLAQYNALTGNAAQAKTDMDRALTLDNDNVDLLAELARANLMLRTKEGENKAIELLTRAKALNDKKPTIFIALGDAWYQQETLESAISNYQNAIGLEAGNVYGRYRLGKAKVENSLSASKINTVELQEGFDQLKKAIELDANFAPAYMELGEVYGHPKVKRYTEARESYRKYVQLRNNDLSARYRYCQFLYLTKDYPAAVTEIKTVLKDTTTNLMYRLLAYSSYELGASLESKKDEPGAKVAYAEAKDASIKYFSAIKPVNIIAKDYEYRGKIAIKEGQLDAGAADLMKAFEMDKARTDLITEIVKGYNAAFQVEQAIKYQKKLVAFDASTQNWYQLAKIYQVNKMFTQADTAYRECVKTRPNFMVGWVELARVNNKLDPAQKKGLAKPMYDKVIELSGGDAVKYKKELVDANHYLSGYYFTVEKDIKRSFEYIEKVLQIDPTYEEGTKLKSYLNDIDKLPPDQKAQFFKQMEQADLKAEKEKGGTNPPAPKNQ